MPNRNSGVCPTFTCVWLFNKLFHFSYKILDAPSDKIAFLWNFCYLFSYAVLWVKQVLMTVSDFSGFFSRIHILERGFTFQWGGGCFSEWGFILKWGVPHGVGIGFDEGGGGSKKIIGWGRGGHTPTKGNPVYGTLFAQNFDCSKW